jgi:hypothetical protein
LFSGIGLPMIITFTLVSSVVGILLGRQVSLNSQPHPSIQSINRGT